MPRKRTVVRVSVGLVVTACIAAALLYTATVSRDSAIAQRRSAATQTLRLYAENLRGQLAKFEILPRLVAASSRFDNGLPVRADVAGRHEIDLYLEEVNGIAGVSDTYLLDTEGYTLAASNWATEVSFVGRNFAFRPYFKQAMEGRPGRYFALGTTSNRRGYYLSYPVERNGKILGVAVIKIGAAALENRFSQQGDTVFVTDPDGVVFLSGRPDWRFRTLEPLAPEAEERIRKSRRYPSVNLQPIGLRSAMPLGGGFDLVSVPLDGSGDRGAPHLMLGQPMPELGWTIHVITPMTGAETEVARNTAAVGFGLAASVMLLVFMLQRRRAIRERLAREEREREFLSRARDELESRVHERTADLQEANARLVREIGERRRAEQDLRRAQEELVQAGKLAALGQLASGITHELSQPLTAIRTYADNARLLLRRGRAEEAGGNLVNISDLVGRTAQIMDHLRVFARKTPLRMGPVSVAETLQRSLGLLRAVGRLDSIEVDVRLPDGDPLVLAEPVRLEQVLINLVQNAADALAGRQAPSIRVTVEQDDDEVAIAVADNGPGINADDAPRLFEPFFTTKEVGKGMGLGLSISYGIADALGGSLRAANSRDGGAVFTLRLKRAGMRAETAHG